jgi:hypothetical protein
MQFLKDHMTGREYNWRENKVFTGAPTRRLFDRFDGNQVLFIINYYGSSEAEFSIEQAREIERKILDRLPLDAKSEISVFNWIANAMQEQAA